MYLGLTFYSGLPYSGINWTLKYAPDSILNVSGRAVGQTRALRQADPILRSPGCVPRPRCSPQRGEDIATPINWDWGIKFDTVKYGEWLPGRVA
jgi:hypothetical protein